MAKVSMESFKGSHYEIGFQQGEATRELVHEALKSISEWEPIKLAKPRLLPMSVFLTMAKRWAERNLRDAVFSSYPSQARRLEGIVRGTGLDLPTHLFFLSVEVSSVGQTGYSIPACTSLGFGRQRTSSGETIVAKNFDYPNDFAPFHLTCRVEPEEGNGTLGCTMAPLPGMLDGMNEHGLTVTYNLAYTTVKPEEYVPISMMLQEMLENCRDTNEAVDFITSARRAGDALLMLADAEGDIRTVELSSKQASARGMIDSLIINTNHYHIPEMQVLEVPRDAVFAERVPKEYLDERIHESSEQRLQRARELLEGDMSITEEKIVRVLSDHGEDVIPSRLTICRHDDFTSTLRSVIFYPERRAIKVLYGNPCENEFVDYSL